MRVCREVIAGTVVACVILLILFLRFLKWFFTYRAKGSMDIQDVTESARAFSYWCIATLLRLAG